MGHSIIISRILIFLILSSYALISCQDEPVTDIPNNSPNAPSNPSPANLDSNIAVGTQLSWTCSDPDDDPMNYDIYLDTLNPPGLIEDRWPNRNYTPFNELAYEKTYYWQVVARDINSAETAGPIWRFRTQKASGLYLVGTCQTMEMALNISLIRDELYVAEGEYGVEIFDVSAPRTPVLIGLFQQPYLNAVDITVIGNYAFIADTYIGLRIVDVSNPFSPYLLEQVNLPFTARALYIQDTARVYVACDTSGLQIVNVQYIQSPFIEGSISFGDVPAEAIFVHENYAYLGCGTRGMYLIDVSDPGNPFFAHNYDTPGTVKGIQVIEEAGVVSAHMADGNYGYRVVDFTQPRNPQLITVLDLPDYMFAVVSSGQYAYLAVSNIGLVITDHSIPPNILTYYDTPGQARNVIVGGGHVFIADGPEGVAILEYIE